MVFTAGAELYSAQPMFRSAYNAIKHWHVNMDVPICLGISVSYMFSIWATIVGNAHVYFDSITMFIFLILIGRYLECSARESASSINLKLFALIPFAAHRIDVDGLENIVPVRSIQSGDIIRIRPGEKVPVDGVIVKGTTRVNEALISGESKGRQKHINDNVIGGSINISGTVDV